ncbi:hypothetical protein NKH18_21850 [Streptomyces sp. M10(2022)]
MPAPRPVKKCLPRSSSPTAFLFLFLPLLCPALPQQPLPWLRDQVLPLAAPGSPSSRRRPLAP